jgi:hypothetical protein
MLLPVSEDILHLFGHTQLQNEEVYSRKTINMQQYLNTNNFSVNNRDVVVKSSQATPLYITKILYKQFSCHGYKKIEFSSEILIKLTFSDSLQPHD